MRLPPKAAALQTGFSVTGCISRVTDWQDLWAAQQERQSPLHLDALDLLGLAGMLVEV